MINAYGLVLLLLCLCIVYATEEQNDILIPFNDPNIMYFGRWRTSTNSIQSGWPGAYFKTTIYGPRIRLILKGPTHVYVQIDTEKPKDYRTQSENGEAIELDITPQIDLGQGPHQLTVAACTNASIELESLLLSDERGTGPVDVLSSTVEFVGHDLTLGKYTSQTILTSYAWAVSEILGTEHAQIALPGARLMDGKDGRGMESQYFEWSPSHTKEARAKWDFSSYKPAAIVILLGRNDYGTEAYEQSLERFLLQVRTHTGPASILVLSEPLGEMVRSSQLAISRRNDLGDENVHFVDTTNWVRYGPSAFVDPGHLNDVGHQTVARKLAPLLQAKLARPRQPFPGPLPNPTLPNGWQTMDVGHELSIGLPGSVSFDSGNTFTLWGSGADISGTRDAFRFVYQALSGDGTLEATVESHSTFASCAKAGIMIREHLSLGSPHVMFGISPADGLFLQTRSQNMNDTRLLKKSRASPPYRLRLIRKDNVFVAQMMRTSVAPPIWDTLGNVSTTFLARDVYAGLAVTSCDTAVVSVAKFVDVSLQGGVGSGSGLRFIDQH
ncbi:hypothetical protein F4703DRAFT_1821359 [Phycomyces blakesleeanus]